MECFKGAELFGNDERCVIRQHDTARTNAYRRSGAREMGNQNRRRRTRDRCHSVVLRDPKPVVAEAFSNPCGFGRLFKSLGR